MTGLIWFVQIVHYPLMRRVGAVDFVAYERHHMQRTTWVVAPLMLLEAVTAVLIAATAPAGVSRVLAWSGLALVAWIWFSTAALQVPCHRRLQAGFDPATLSRLVATNWGRTAAWSVRSVLALALLGAANAA
ncbi:MAG: hypothetical protein ACYS15_09345 [Planctomycetota bacterium]